MPTSEPRLIEGSLVVSGGVKHHLDETLHTPIDGHVISSGNTEPPRERWPHLLRIEMSPLDLTGPEDISRERPQRRFLAQRKT